MYVPYANKSRNQVVRSILDRVALQVGVDLVIVAQPDCRDVAVVEAEYVAILFPGLEQPPDGL